MIGALESQGSFYSPTKACHHANYRLSNKSKAKYDGRLLCKRKGVENDKGDSGTWWVGSIGG